MTQWKYDFVWKQFRIVMKFPYGTSHIEIKGCQLHNVKEIGIKLENGIKNYWQTRIFLWGKIFVIIM